MDKEMIEKLLKRKEKLYIKFLKNKSIRNEQIYKNYKHLFEKLRKKLSKYFINLYIRIVKMT